MSYEVEVKYRVVDHDQLADVLAEMGAVATGTVDQEDIYLSHPARDFAQTNEAFRIRRLGEENRITYKGPRHAGPTKTREEIEVPVASGLEPFQRLLALVEILGFRPIAKIRKRRKSFHLVFQDRPLEIVLDVVKDLGAFAEIEAIVRRRADLPAAQQAVIALARAVGLTEAEPRSYLRMILDREDHASCAWPPGP
jgi:adenylate cyclase class 2